MARKIKAKLIMELREQGVSPIAWASATRDDHADATQGLEKICATILTVPLLVVDTEWWSTAEMLPLG